MHGGTGLSARGAGWFIPRRARAGREKKSQRNLFATVQNGGICTSFWWWQWPRPESRELPWVSAVAGAGREKGTPTPPRLPAGPSARSVVPCLPPPPPPRPKPASPQPRASSPWTLTPVYKHSLGAGWGGRNAGWRGGGGGPLPRTPPAERDEELVRESGPGSWKGLNALFLKLSIPSTPIVRASCKTSQAF